MTSSVRHEKDIQPGDHLCAIYQTEQEHRALLTSYLRQGLTRNEKVVFFYDARSSEMLVGTLENDSDFPLKPYLTSGQCLIAASRDTYLNQGEFDPDRMISLLRIETEKALSEGYSALRVTGEMTWALTGAPGSERLIEYEITLNSFFSESKALALCQYDARSFGAELLLDVLQAHPLVMLGTELYDNMYYMPPEQALSDQTPRHRLDHWMANMKRTRSEKNALAGFRSKLQAVFDASFDAILVFDRGICIDQNIMAEKFFGYTPEEALGKPETDWIAPEDRPRFQKTTVLKSETPLEVSALRKNGSTFPAEMQRKRFQIGERFFSLTLFRDITNRKMLETTFRDSRNLLDQRVKEKTAELQRLIDQLIQSPEKNCIPSGRAGKQTIRSDSEKPAHTAQLPVHRNKTFYTRVKTPSKKSQE